MSETTKQAIEWVIIFIVYVTMIVYTFDRALDYLF